MNDNNNYVSTLCEIMFVFMLIGKPGHACKTTSVCENICICTLSLSLSLFFPSLSPSLSLSLSLTLSRLLTRLYKYQLLEPWHDPQ